MDHLVRQEHAVALKPGSEHRPALPDDTRPDDYMHDHPTEHPEDWGWHGEFGKWARVAGWVVAIILLLMMTATHYNLQGALFLGLSAGLIVLALLYDRQRRKNSWRS